MLKEATIGGAYREALSDLQAAGENMLRAYRREKVPQAASALRQIAFAIAEFTAATRQVRLHA